MPTWSVQARIAPVTVEESTLRAYTGSYGKRKVTLQDGSLYYYESDDDATYRLEPLTQNRFAAAGRDDFQLEFAVTGDGQVTVCYIVWDDAFRSTLTRTE